ncbi:MAG: hypothetical protein UW75_C0003G0007 [Parcubacteria group bacterium GW2011_GWF2_44_8]|nr:MAG: hypothetical protein UW75_C0003G0007 [Parcubacteria group bacterium GW2011_GWF2_44_8]
MKHVLVSIFIFLFLPIFVTHAQIGASIAEPGISIKITPTYPEPNTAFTASLDDYSSIDRVTNIAWKVDGEVIPSAANLRELNLRSMEGGQSTIIEAVVTFSTGRTQTIKQTVTPRYLDIIVEAQTKTPSFYLGRPLPSADSTVNLTAVLSNTAIANGNLLYTWRLNNTVIGGGAQRGKNKTSITTPAGTAFLIGLEVSTLTGEILARRTVSVPSVSPTLHFYEKSSLYGLSNRSVSSLNLTGDSITMQAEPYNLAIETYNLPDLVEWKINGAVVRNPNQNPYEITLTADNQTFSASTIDFHVRNLSSLLQGVRGQFKLNF